jgi:hypothetical protein
MTHCAQNLNVSKYRRRFSDKYKRKSERLAKMRAAKEQKRLANPVEREPERVRYSPLQLGIRNKLTGETAWVDFKSIRDAVKRLAVIKKYYLCH